MDRHELSAQIHALIKAADPGNMMSFVWLGFVRGLWCEECNYSAMLKRAEEELIPK